jgi:L-threonylcarbamoyladenylate synthase
MSRRTEILPVSPEALARAAVALRGGELVAFPTETVYGLGAHALDAAAVGRIFAAKGRPATNPVIVHVATFDEALALAASMPPMATALAQHFWPGPLTLVVPRGPRVPDIVTAGGPTVAIRIPSHPVAKDLLHAAGVPVAAPSANRSTCLSPTRAEHVLRGLDGRIDFLIDGGPCPGGLESTVLDVTTSPPTLLRPGGLSIRLIEEAIGPIRRSDSVAAGIARSPGQMKRHYAPATPLEFTADNGEARVRELTAEGLRVGWLTLIDAQLAGVVIESLPADPAAYGANLFAALHRLDDAGLDRVVIAVPPEDDDWLAIHDRLGRMR